VLRLQALQLALSEQTHIFLQVYRHALNKQGLSLTFRTAPVQFHR
jgi:hypothetical protein